MVRPAGRRNRSRSPFGGHGHAAQVERLLKPCREMVEGVIGLRRDYCRALKAATAIRPCERGEASRSPSRGDCRSGLGLTRLESRAARSRSIANGGHLDCGRGLTGSHASNLLNCVGGRSERAKATSLLAARGRWSGLVSRPRLFSRVAVRSTSLPYSSRLNCASLSSGQSGRWATLPHGRTVPISVV